MIAGKTFFLILVGFSSVAAASRVWFLNGESIEADFANQFRGRTFVTTSWHPEPIPIPSRLLDHVVLTPGRKHVENTSLLMLSNGDKIRGRIKSLDATSLEIETSWGQTLRIHRHALRSLGMQEEGEGVVMGLGSLRDWSDKNGGPGQRLDGRVAETHQGFRFQGNGNISRTFPLSPEGMTLDFTLRLSGMNPHTTIILEDIFREKGKRVSYHLTITRSQIYSRVMEQAGRSSIDWRLSLRNLPHLFENGGTLTVTIDPKDCAMQILWENVLLHAWNLPEVEYSNRKHFGIDLRMMRSQGDSFLHDLRISKGVRTGIPELSARNKDWILLDNRDELTGQVMQINPERVQIRIDSIPEPLNLNPGRIQRIDLSMPRIEIPKRHNEDVRVTFRDGGKCTVRIQGVEDERLFLQSDMMEDTFQVPLREVSLIEYNPYVPEMSDDWELGVEDLIQHLD